MLFRSALAASQGHLRGIAVVEPSIPFEEMTRMHALGVRGIRFNLFGAKHNLAPWLQQAALWDQMTELGWHVELHTDPGRLPEVLPQLPSAIRVVVDHMSKPLKAHVSDPTIEMLRRDGSHRVMVKLSGAYRQAGIDAHELTQVLLGEMGPDALLWGSDWPCTNHEPYADYAALRASLDQWLGQGPVDQVVCHNPMRLYWNVTHD